MGNIVTGHGQNWELGDGTLLALDKTCTLVKHSQVSVHVTWVTTSPRHFFTCSTNLSQCVTIVGHVSVDNEDVVVLLERQVFSGGESKTWGNDSLDSWIVSKVDEQHSVFKRTSSLQIGTEEVVFFSGDSHSTEHNNEFFIGILEFGLSGDLQSNVVVRETRCRENWQLLSTHQTRTQIDSGHTSLNEIIWTLSAVRVNRSTDDVFLLVSDNFWTAVTWSSCTIENASNEVGAHREFENVTHEGDTGFSVDFGGPFEHLNDDEVIGGVEHLSVLDGTIGES